MFQTSRPATHEHFQNRDAELTRLLASLDRLKKGAPQWLALLGPRKIGKTSLLLTLADRAQGVAIAVIDVLECAPLSAEVFRRAALRCMDALLAEEIGVSLEALSTRPSEYRAALLSSPRLLALEPVLRAQLLELPEAKLDAELLCFCLDLPERLAVAWQVHLVLAMDEFQELAALGEGRHGVDVLPLARSLWQRHTRVAYIISGSSRSMLTELVTSERSPFFQHFALMEVGPFSHEHAVRLIQTAGADETPIPREIAERAVAILGGNPFYLQLLGEALSGAPVDEDALKEALQNLLFSRTGRLALTFENEYHQRVGRASTLAATLSALAEGPRRLTDIAAEIHAATGSVVRYLERLGDTVERDPDGLYRLADPVFGLWLRWRNPGGTVVPMSLVGDEGEQRVAAALARMGFDLVYVSRASRGAFDLMAIRGAAQVGVQVRARPLPLRFSTDEWARMEAEAVRFGWEWVVAAAPPDRAEVLLLDPAGARIGKEIRIEDDAAIPNLLRWVDDRAKRRALTRR